MNFKLELLYPLFIPSSHKPGFSTLNALKSTLQTSNCVNERVSFLFIVFQILHGYTISANFKMADKIERGNFIQIFVCMEKCYTPQIKAHCYHLKFARFGLIITLLETNIFVWQVYLPLRTSSTPLAWIGPNPGEKHIASN